MKTTQINTIEIDNSTYALPTTLNAKEIATLGALLLQLKRVRSVWCEDYKNMHYLSAHITVQLGSTEIYASEAEAKETKDQYNAQLAAAKLMSEPETVD
jgi:hypothetical protein